MTVHNSFVELMEFFEVGPKEFMLFWNELSLKERVYYRTVDLKR